MLLFTRLAPPKVPKRRSRAGCTYCKEKKKKCDEGRPQCIRCAERGLSCLYEPVKPRQRKKRTQSSSSSATNHQSPDRVLASLATSWRRKVNMVAVENKADMHDNASSPENEPKTTPAGCTARQEAFPTTPLDLSFDPSDMFAFDSGLDMPLTSPLSSPTTFDFGELGLGRISEISEGYSNGEEERNIPVPEMAMISSRSPRSSFSSAAAVPMAAAAPSPLLLQMHMPSFVEFTARPNRRALVDHFCNVLSHLIVFREEGGNPFQQLILPLSHRSLPVMNALYALASAHLEYRGVKNEESSVHFHNMAIQGLAKLIERDDKSSRNELLAAIMLLVYYEVLVQKGRSNIVDGHLKGAMTVINSSHSVSDPTGVFLERAFRFYDVIAALSFGTAPLSAAPAAGYLAPFPPVDSADVSALSNVDTLLGMATTLWPMMHRLSTLVSLKADLERAVECNQSSKVAVMRTELETTSSAIEVALKQWQPVLPNSASLPVDDSDMTEDQARLLSTLNNALAYRHSALVYLYRTIHGYPPGHDLVQTHAHAALTHCFATVSHAGPMGALLWPLFVAACEAITDSDRGMARTAFGAVERRQGMNNIGRAWDIVQEVWRRADVLATTPMSPGSPRFGGREGRAPHLWRRVSEDMGVTIVFG